MVHTARHSTAPGRPALSRRRDHQVRLRLVSLSRLVHRVLSESPSLDLWLCVVSFVFCVGNSYAREVDPRSAVGGCMRPDPPAAGIRRDVWQHSIAAGAHAYLLALWGWLAGGGWVLASQQPADSKAAVAVQPTVSAPTSRKAPTSRQQHVPQGISAESTDDWCVD